MQNKLAEAVKKLLVDSYTLPNGKVVKAQTSNQVVKSLRWDGWKNLGAIDNFELKLQALGFDVVNANNTKNGRLAIIVTLHEEVT